MELIRLRLGDKKITNLGTIVPFFLKSNMKKNIKFLIISYLLVLFDQITKIYFKGYSLFGFEHTGFEYGERVNVFGEYIQFTFVENPGMAFSIEFGAGKIFLSLFSVVATIAISWALYLVKNVPAGIKIGMSLILAGAAGNMIDRVFYGVFYGYAPLFYGKVVDFILVDIPDISIGNINYEYFPVFNVADSCVTCGLFFLIIFHKHIPSIENFRMKIKNDDQLNEESQQ